jgi:transaldolase
MAPPDETRPSSRLDGLRALSEVVPETADLAAVQQYGARHVNLSASHITSAAQDPAHNDVVLAAIDWAQKKVGKGGNRKLVAIRAVERLPVELARRLIDIVDGDVSIEVDGRLAYKRRATIDRARALVDQLEEAGVPKQRVLLKITGTWEGIQAADKLREKNDIRCHMTLVFGMHQLAACADAGAAVIAPAVGRITDWHKKKLGVDGFSVDDDPGVKQAIAMHGYLKQHGYDSKLMPGTFRNVEQAIALAGCELLTLPPKLLTLLEESDGAVQRRLDGDGATPATDKLVIDAATFQAMNADDPVSAAKLSSGVKNHSWALVAQEKQLGDWISTRQDVAASSSTVALFQTWDYDGDGFIDREEWNGTEAVFNAIDRDNNGRISLEEMAIGLGAPFKPEE